MEYKDRVKIIMETLRHKNGKIMACNTLWVGSMAQAKVCHILGGKYGETDAQGELDKALIQCRQGKGEAYNKIDEVFKYLLHYMLSMGTLEEHYRQKIKDERMTEHYCNFQRLNDGKKLSVRCETEEAAEEYAHSIAGVAVINITVSEVAIYENVY